MARIQRDARIESRDARSKLKGRQVPYWRQIHKGLAIGYRKGAKGGVWLCRRLVEGKYLWDRIGTADDHQDANGLDVLDYKQAHYKALEISDAAAKQDRGVRSGPYTVGDAARDYLAWYKVHKKGYAFTESTINAHILPKFKNKLVADLTAPQIKKWHQDLAMAPPRLRNKKDSKERKVREIDFDDPEALRKRKATANRILTILKAALNQSYENGHTPSADAWHKVKPFREVDMPKIRYLSEAECKRLINACDADFRLLAQAALFSGCRYGELINLQVSDFNRDSGTVLVRSSKAGKSRHVPLTDQGRQFFERATAGKTGEQLIFTNDDAPWAKSHQTRPMKQACKAAKISPVISFHILRHTYGSLLALKGVPLQVIAQAMGHADTRMTEKHYAHLMPDYVAETIRANLPDFGYEPDNVTQAKRPRSV